MKLHRSHPRRRSAMSILEMSICMAVFSAAMTALLSASVALQTSYAATDDYFTSQGDQMRVMDYFNTDLRRALAVSLNSSTVTYSGVTYSNTIPTGATKYLTVAIPNYRDETSSPSAVRFPTITADSVSYGTSPIIVSYYLLGTSLFRLEVDPDLSANDPRNNATSIADNVSDFSITDSLIANPLITETVVSISATFPPKYSRGNWTASLTSNTTNCRVGTTVGSEIQLRNIF